MLSAVVVSNEIIRRSIEERITLTPLKLQKILYFVYGHYYAKTGKRLFSEPFLVWKYGPVVQAVYDEFGVFGASNITRLATDAQGDIWVPSNDCGENADFFSSFEETWNHYKNKSASELVDLTHEKESPWHNADKKGDLIIDDNEILEYFKKKRIE
jgi:uncharacterized phage-associated protein